MKPVLRNFLELTGYIEEDYRNWDDLTSARVIPVMLDRALELMPTANRELFTFKYVNSHPAILKGFADRCGVRYVMLGRNPRCCRNDHRHGSHGHVALR